MWEPQRLTTVWASTAFYRDSLALAFKESMEEHRLITAKPLSRSKYGVIL
jgi:hypothetical protein